MNLTNFQPVSNQELDNIYGGFALSSFITIALMTIMTWKLFSSEKGSLHINGVGEAKWDDPSSKGMNTHKVIYYPY